MPRLEERGLPRIAIDTEGTGLNVWHGAKPFAMSACNTDGDTWWWEFDVDPFTREPQVSEQHRQELRELCGDRKRVKCFWNAAYDIPALSKIGVEVVEPYAEITFMARSFNSLELAYALKPLSKKYVDFDDGDQKDLAIAVKKCRRICKKLGWKIAQKTSSNSKAWMSDYWLPETLWRLRPDLAEVNDIPRGLCEEYGVNDAVRTILLDSFYRLAMAEMDAMDPALGCQRTYAREMALLPTSLEMERVGVTFDPRRMPKLLASCDKKIAADMKVLRAASGRDDFNFNAAEQVQQLLFEPMPEGKTTPKGNPKKRSIDPRYCLRLPVMRRTDTGNPKVDAEALVPYATNPVVRAILSAKANSKAKSTFFLKYEALSEVDEEGNHWIHPRWQQWNALTGRYTCKDPNLQQVSNPATTNSRSAEFVVNVRQVFIPRKGRPYIHLPSLATPTKNKVYHWFAPDYSQVEVIIFAEIANEPTMLDAIHNGVDVHTATTNKIWGGEGNLKAFEATARVLRMAGDSRAESDYGIEELLIHFDWDIVKLEKSFDQKIWRKLAKTVTFTKIFGGGPNALMSWIGCDRSEAVTILADYDESFPQMTESMTEIASRGRSQGYVVNPWGRRLSVDRWKAYRAVNYLVQSSAADLMKDGMRSCNAYLRNTGLDARIAMTIHDELMFEIKREHCFKKVLRKLCDLMADHGGRFKSYLGVDIERIDERWSKKVKVVL